MANKTLFQSMRGWLMPATDALNEEGAPAWSRSPRQALAQYAATGCLNATFYASETEQLAAVLALANEVDADFVARTAVYARERARMKDMPALLAATLARRAPALLEAIFARVIDDGRMLRTFVQIMRSGVTGRKSFGTAPKRLVRRWLERRTDEEVFRASVGQDPSIADVIRMVHPKPATASREALYGWLIGRPYDPTALPEIVRRFEAYKAGADSTPPDVPFRMLTGLPLGRAEWARIAERASWDATRMNLNTFARHGVFEDEGLVGLVAERLRDQDAIVRARAFPYQLMAARAAASGDVPRKIIDALVDAMEMTVARVPAMSGTVYVCPDVSGSMHSPITGVRRGATTVVRCVDVAALVAATVLRRNPEARILPFNDRVRHIKLSARDTVLTNATLLAQISSGGTSVSAPIAWLNRHGARADLVVIVSDNESWVDAGRARGTATLAEWNRFKQSNPSARLVCLDLQPTRTVQAPDREDVLNVGGFSDAVFDVIRAFADGRLIGENWAGAIEQIVV